MMKRVGLSVLKGLTVILALLVGASLFAASDPPRRSGVTTMEYLRQQYGSASNLTASQTRALYKRVLANELGSWNHSLVGEEETAAKAEACSVGRALIRLYARERDGDAFSLARNALLAVRDWSVHGVPYVILALRADLFRPRNDSLRTFVALSNLLSCQQVVGESLLGSLFSGDAVCPTYSALRLARTDEQVLASCTKTNELFNALAGGAESAKLRDRDEL